MLVSSNNERLYAALETAYGQVPAITAQNRIPLMNLGAKQIPVATGGRIRQEAEHFPGFRTQFAETRSFQLSTLMTEWTNQTARLRRRGRCFKRRWGRAPSLYGRNGGAASRARRRFNSRRPHGLTSGAGDHFGDRNPVCGGGGEYDYGVHQRSVHDYARGRSGNGRDDDVLAGGGLGEREPLRLLGSKRGGTADCERRGDGQDADKSERRFPGVRLFGAIAGFAGQRELHQRGKGGLTAYPAEPAQTGFDYTIVPGNLGQVWMGATPNEFFYDYRGGIDAGE